MWGNFRTKSNEKKARFSIGYVYKHAIEKYQGGSNLHFSIHLDTTGSVR